MREGEHEGRETSRTLSELLFAMALEQCNYPPRLLSTSDTTNVVNYHRGLDVTSLNLTYLLQTLIACDWNDWSNNLLN